MDWSNYDPAKFAWLEKRAYNLHTQEGADGILEAIFERIGAGTKYVCEFGAADGLWFSNSRRLIEQGWRGLLIEGDSTIYPRLEERYRDNLVVETVNAYVQPRGEYSIESLLDKVNAPKDLDLLVIDIDGQDYYILNSLWKYRPRVIVCEYDARVDSMFIPELGGSGQAGDKAIIYVGNARGYMPVCKTAYNIIFVRNDLVDLCVEEPAIVQDDSLVRLCAVMTTPRLGFLSTMDCVFSTMASLNSGFVRTEGVFWNQSLTRGIESALEKGANYILSIDFDSLFSVDDVKRLVCHLYDNPDVDIVVPIQMKREGGEPLISTDGEVDLTQSLVPIRQGHFGLTIFRASLFENIEKPWLREVPDESNGWGDGRTDPDIYFWQNCRENDIKVVAALDVVIGHLEQVATWPAQNFAPFHQTINDWRKSGKPANAFIKPPAQSVAKAATMTMQQ